MVIAVAAPMALLSAWTVAEVVLRESQVRRESMMFAARTILRAVDAEIEASIAVAAALATSPALLDNDFDAFEKQAQAVTERFPGIYILVSDTSGQQLFNTVTPRGAPLPKRGWVDAQSRMFESNEPVISDLFIGATIRRPIAAVSVPVFRDGRPHLTVSASLDPNSFSRILLQHPAPPGWLTGLVDRNGNYVARSEGHNALVGKPASQGWRASMHREGFADFLDRDGNAITNVNVISRLSGWVVGVAARKAAFEAPIRQTLYWASAGAVVVTLTSLLIAFSIAARIARPMRELETKAQALVAGGSAHLNSSVPDIERVWSALNEAVGGRQQFEAAMLESRDRLALAVSAGNFGIFDRDLVSGHGVWDERVRQIWGFSPDEEVNIDKLAAAVHPDDRKRFDETRANSTVAIEGHVDRKHNNEYRVINQADGRVRWINSFGRVTFSGGQAVRLVGIIMDVTERKLHEQHLEFVMRELSHRSKNLLAVVQSIARQTASQSDDFEEFNRKFVARIGALAAAHDILVKNDWIGGTIRDVVLSQLEPFEGKPCVVEGPDVLIAPEAVQNIALAIHELVTNAAKHGALSRVDGAVSVTWAIENDRDAERLRLTWRESGAPCAAEAGREGFGTIVLRRVVPTALDASAHLERDANGMTYRLDIPLRWIAQATAIIGRLRRARSAETATRSPDEPLGASQAPKVATAMAPSTAPASSEP